MRLLALILCFTLTAPLLGADAAKPNIIVILADDLGWGSLGCYGGKGLQTPHLDRLAAEGRRFNHAYAPGSVCSPTRYALMTGRYYWRTSVKDGEVLGATSPLHIETDRVNLGSLCKSQGYATAAVGKWHLGLGSGPQNQRDWSKPFTPGPREIGFDYFYGLPANVGFQGPMYAENDRIVSPLPEGTIAEAKGKKQAWEVKAERGEDLVMDRLTQKAVAWIEQNRAKPFFLYFAPNAIHEPITPAARFDGKSPYGVYGDFIRELDDSVGRILGVLEKHNLTGNTLVVFTSDNGGVANRTNKHVDDAMNAGLSPNGPLRGGKHDEWEGGFREPFIVRWPGKVPAGTVSDEIIGINDVLATLASVLGAPLKSGAEDSLDVSAAWFGTGPSARKSMILQDADAAYAVRSGPWKFIERENAPAVPHRNKKKAELAAKQKKRVSATDELFNLAEDPAETKNVAAAHPEVVQQLRAILKAARENDRTR